MEEDEELLGLEPQHGPGGSQQTLGTQGHQGGSRTPRAQQDVPLGREMDGVVGGISGEVLSQLLVNAGNGGPELLARTLECIERWSQLQGPAQATMASKQSNAPQGALIEDAPGPGLFDEKLVDADPRLKTVLSLGFHLPLTMCTNRALLEVSRGRQLLMATHHDRNGQKKTIVDVSQWPREEDMTAEQWRDAIPNYLNILRTICKSEVVRRFEEHFEYLQQRSGFDLKFNGILKFDISIRRGYFVDLKCRPFTVRSPEYCNELTQACNAQTAEEGQLLKEEVRQLREELSAVRYHPYSRPNTATGAGGGRSEGEPHNRPFSQGRTSVSAGFLCLICGLRGHKADRCTRSKTSAGKPVYAIWASGKLLAATSRKEFCIRWNARGPAACRGCSLVSSGGHSCSFCGSPDHHAGGQRCL